jgi:hypothetical protein
MSASEENIPGPGTKEHFLKIVNLNALIALCFL